MQNKKSLLLMLAMAFFAVLVLVGCSDDSTTEEVDKKETDSTAETATEYPMTIKHALGEAVLDSKPERIVTIQWANHDIALALGVVPVGFSAANFGVQDDSGLLPWTKEKDGWLDLMLNYIEKKLGYPPEFSDQVYTQVLEVIKAAAQGPEAPNNVMEPAAPQGPPPPAQPQGGVPVEGQAPVGVMP